MSAYKLEKMKEIYFGFSDEFKLALSIVRILEHTDLDKVDKVHKKGLKKETALAIKNKNKLRKAEIKTLSGSDKSCFKKCLEDFGYEVDILAFDLENADYEIEKAKEEIQYIRQGMDSLSKGKRRKITAKLDKIKAKVLMYCIAREKIKFYYDSISNSAKFGYKAIKIRKEYDVKYKGKIAAIDKNIARQTKILNTKPKVKKSKKNSESFA